MKTWTLNADVYIFIVFIFASLTPYRQDGTPEKKALEIGILYLVVVYKSVLYNTTLVLFPADLSHDN